MLVWIAKTRKPARRISPKTGNEVQDDQERRGGGIYRIRIMGGAWLNLERPATS